MNQFSEAPMATEATANFKHCVASHTREILKRDLKRDMVTAGVLAIAALALVGCAKKAAGPAGPPPAMPVTVVTLQPTDVPLASEWVGTLDGNVNAQIQPQVSGYLIQQTYREGSDVAKGEVLFEIDPRPFQAALDQAQGQLEQAKAAYGLAQTNVNRDTPLAQERAIAQSQLDTDKAQLAQTDASVKAAEASVETANLNLGFTHVRSLISGVAGQAMTQVGNLVGPQSVLTSVSQLNPIRVYFSISDQEYLAMTARARAGKGSLLSNAAKVPLTLKLANGETYPQKGHIAFVDRQVNSQTGAIRIAATFPNPGNLLRPGQFGRVKGETQVRNNVLLVPQVAIQEFQGTHQVYIAGTDGKAHVETVQLGSQVGTNWLVESGLSPGMQVIVDNLLKLRDGSPVSPHQASADTSTAAATAQNNASAGR
jgi:membrane fusion protein (multidrug efflux system)